MSQNKDPEIGPDEGPPEIIQENIAPGAPHEASSTAGSVQGPKMKPSSNSERQLKYEKAQRTLENAALVSKRIKEHRKAAAELLGKPFEEDDICDTSSEMTAAISERTGYSAATEASTTLSVQEALNIPGISESLANTLKQKELLMERIKQYKEQASTKRPSMKSLPISRRDSVTGSVTDKKVTSTADTNEIEQLQNILKAKDNALSLLQVKMKAMETTIMDLQEKISEKDQIIDAKNRATTLMSDNISKKEKDSLALLDDTRLQMSKMQENFIAMESEWKEERQNLLKQLEVKDEKIKHLEEANSILEAARFEITVKNGDLLKEIEDKSKIILELETQLKNVSQSQLLVTSTEEEEEKGSKEISAMDELTKKVELLEQLNCQMRQTNKELENKLASANPNQKATTQGSPSKKPSPLPTRKGGKSAKMKSPWSNLTQETATKEAERKQSDSKSDPIIQSLSKEILEKEYIISQKDNIISQKDNLLRELEAKVKENELLLKNINERNVDKEIVDIGINTEINAGELHKEPTKMYEPFTPQSELTPEYMAELEAKIREADEQIVLLNNEIETANKNMVKVKSNHKLKLKQMQKTIESFSKISDTNAEVVRLNEEISILSQKVAELEEEKGNLQLHLVDYDSGRFTDTDAYKKVLQLEALADSRLKAISNLETQKLDLVQDLHLLQQKNIEMEDKLADIIQSQNEQVSSELKSVQLEEEIDKISASKRDLELTVDSMKQEIQQLHDTIKQIELEKHEMEQKLEHYVQENMELTDKIEKMSAEKVSSAESIEIVESLTTQETLELEQYNKGVTFHELQPSSEPSDNTVQDTEKIQKLKNESAELNRKIELFSQEREEVMEKMNKITFENEQLHHKIFTLDVQMTALKSNIEAMDKEKCNLENLNKELVLQIDELKKERMELMKDSVDLSKPPGVTEEAMEASTESTSDKNSKGVKTVKQLTKDILKLKNVVKEREAEIADCQMKILSLEEQVHKNSELVQSNLAHENKIKQLDDENDNLKTELSNLKTLRDTDNQVSELMQQNELLHQEMMQIQQEYNATVNSRDLKVKDLESILLEYERQLQNYASAVQQKDKELSEYVNQITKLNDVCQKLRSTIEVLEEEKEKDQNSEIVKSLNKQIAAYQKKLGEYEERTKLLDEEKTQLLSVRGSLEGQNKNMETEINNLKETLVQTQIQLAELQTQQSKHASEMSEILQQTKERDEEIHEVKLQLRKESIEKEKLRDDLFEKDKIIDAYNQELEDLKERLSKYSIQVEEANSQYALMETKNGELMDKLKKYAANLKKRTLLNHELEAKLQEMQVSLEQKSNEIEQLSLQVEVLPSLEEKLRCAGEETTRLMGIKSQLESQKSSNDAQLLNDNRALHQKWLDAAKEIENLTILINTKNAELTTCKNETEILKSEIEAYDKKIVEFEMEQRNNINFLSKIASLENEITQKQSQINDLTLQLESQQKTLYDIQAGRDAKLQEKELFIEALEIEVDKYKDRISRLEDSISTMEDRRHSLERKASQLDTQLQEKQKAYSQYTNQEDELVRRLASLMDHDREVENQLNDIKSENKELRSNLGEMSHQNESLRKYLTDIETQYFSLKEKESRYTAIETEYLAIQQKIVVLENNLKKISSEYQLLTSRSKQDVEDLEAEFHTQIENALKEKKIISEKYEKLCETVAQLEQQNHEYRSNISNLNANLEEMSKMSQDIIERSHLQKANAPDYTEQYINEINSLNAVINRKNEEINEINAKYLSMKSNLECKVSELTNKLEASLNDIQKLTDEVNNLKQQNEILQCDLLDKDKKLKNVKDKKRVSFEMNIPKTEGLVISSTFEDLGDAAEPPFFDVSTMESQIVTGDSVVKQKTQEVINPTISVTGEIVEPKLVRKDAYLCYSGDETDRTKNIESDPFNSDEGWGFGENESSEVIMPGFSQFNNQISALQKENEALKTDLNARNIKLQKAMKKLKELKTSNEMLTKEIKLSKQLSQTSSLDMAMEDEFSHRISELEQQVDELKKDIAKEKRDKENVLKQNEVLNNAHDRLMEMKEKLENDIELWKYRFNEANNKIQELDWGSDNKTTQAVVVAKPAVSDSRLIEELTKLEKENDEMIGENDRITLENKELLAKQSQLLDQVNKMQKELLNMSPAVEKSQSLERQVLELKQKIDALNKQLAEASVAATQELIIENQNEQDDLRNSNVLLKQQIQELNNQLAELLMKNEKFSFEYELLQKNFETESAKLNENNCTFEKQLKSLNTKLEEYKTQNSSLLAELNEIRSNSLLQEEHGTEKTTEELIRLNEKFSTLEHHRLQLEAELETANTKISQLSLENASLLEKVSQCNEQILEEQNKIEKLNSENDNLLATVAELRSTLSTAVDQRGYEIAELWKQHLAQREADFQNLEQELRSQLSGAENKYEQLLDSMQSSSQEETNQLVVLEQFNSLQAKLKDKEEHLVDLQNKYAEAVNQIDMLRSELEDEKVLLENKLLSLQEDYEKQMSDLTGRHEESVKNILETAKQLQADLAKEKEINARINQHNEDLRSEITKLETNIAELSRQLRIKDAEIQQKTNDVAITLGQRNEEFDNLRKQLLDYEKILEDLNYEKESDLAVLRLKIHENNDYFEKTKSELETEKAQLSEELNAKIFECGTLNRQIADLNKTLEEYSQKMTEMQSALENQEIEIVTLKDEITQLDQLLRTSSSKIEKHVTFASDTKPGDESTTEGANLSKDFLDYVPKAELDLALYMMHQRDVRCDELIMELTQLLDERDTLQLRLSDSIRSYEELKTKCQAAGIELALSTSQETLPEVANVENEQLLGEPSKGQTSRSSSIGDFDGDGAKLQAKLSELKSVKHSRDVTLRHDSESRQLGVRLMQRDVANLPPEAVHQLTQAHHSFSRDSQSTPTVLLNWLRGKSTPKVVHM